MSATTDIEGLRQELERQKQAAIKKETKRIEDEFAQDLKDLERIAARVQTNGTEPASEGKVSRKSSGRLRKGMVKATVIRIVKALDSEYTAEIVHEHIARKDPSLAEKIQVSSIGVSLRRLEGDDGLIKKVRKGTYKTLPQK